MTINIALFKNEKKEKESQPDYTGYNNETGDSVAGWIKTAKNGSIYISLSFETKQEKEKRLHDLKDTVNSNEYNQSPRANTQRPVAQPETHPMEGFDDPIPFFNPYKYIEYVV